MPLSIASQLPTVLVKKDAFEQSGLTRPEIDSKFGLTDAEFRVEGGLIAIGPLPSDDMVGPLIEFFEARGVVYYDNLFELSGNWPSWVRLYAMSG